MKKLVCVFLVCVMFCSLISCSEEKEEETISPAQEVVNRIEGITDLYGEFDDDGKNEQELISIEQAYEQLSESEKQQVSNYDKLKKARYTCDKHNLAEKIQDRAEIWARGSLKTPSSFKLRDVAVTFYIDANSEKFICYGAYAWVDFSGTNDFGATKDCSAVFYMTIDENGNIHQYEGNDFDELMESKNATKDHFG